MKKFIYGALAIGILFLLSGCGAKEKTIECTLSSNDKINGYQLNSTYTIYAKGDSVEKVVTKEEVTSDSEEILNYFESTLKTTYEAADKAYGGYQYSVDKKDNKVVSDVTIDYNKMNVKQYVTDVPALKNYVKNDKLTVEGLTSLYEGMGATCKK